MNYTRLNYFIQNLFKGSSFLLQQKEGTTSVKAQMRISSSYCRLLCVAMVLMYCFLYEWVNIFNIPDIKIYVNILKLILPLVLLLGVFSRLSLKLSVHREYLFYFALFMVWGLVPNLLSGHIQETMLQWLKYIPRILFCYIMFVYLLQQPELNTPIMKAIVVLAACTVLQYVGLLMFYCLGNLSCFSLPIAQETTYFGPYGLLGDGNAYLYFGDFDLKIFRLTGFWFEPSSVSGFLFMAFFLSKSLVEQTKQQWCKLLGILCLLGGLLTFSNAGQVALACALLCGCILRFNKVNYQFITKIIILLIWIFLAIFGRGLVAEHSPNNIIMKNLTGVRDSVKDPYGGRIEETMYSIKILLEHPEGIGFRITGIDSEGKGFKYSASAPLFWLVSTGWIGLLLLLLRESQVLKFVWKNSHSITIFQAWSVLFFQNLAFGTWMTPLYFLLIAIMFSSVYSRVNINSIDRIATAR